MENASMTLLYTVPTANGQRASIALEECDIEYEARMVDLVAGEHRSEEMLELNPFGRMPVLEKDDSAVVYGSMAIGLHAAETSNRLLPSDADRDAFNHWLGVIMTDLVPAFAWQFYLGVLAPEKFDWGLQYGRDVIARILAAIDAHLGANDYFLAGGYSLADVLFYPASMSASRIGDGLDPYPHIARWAAAVGERDAVRRGMAVSS
jgi:GST-like protein